MCEHQSSVQNDEVARKGIWTPSLPPQEARLQPFEEIACDSIGPWTVPIPGMNLKFSALTTICTVSNLCEISRKQNDTSLEAGSLLEISWLHCYPRPLRCIHDGEAEFKYGFLPVLQQWGIKNVSVTAHNPQSNAICERMHQTVAQILRTYIRTNPPQNQQKATTLIDHTLSSASYANAQNTQGIPRSIDLPLGYDSECAPSC